MDAVTINPAMLEWARETAGFSLEQAADKLAIRSNRKVSAAEKLAAVESGKKPVSQGLLNKAVTTYKRPLLAFYLERPPPRADRGEDFRTLPGAHPPRENALLDALVRDLRARQQIVRDVLLDEEDNEPRKLAWVGSASVKDRPEIVADQIRSELGIAVAQQRGVKDHAALFTMLRIAAERMGVYVLLLGDLVTHHPGIDETVFRGIALADDVAPFICINPNDAVPARAFTLVHELTHIFIGATGVSGALTGKPASAVEQFCNAVAGLFLLPPEALEDIGRSRPADVNQALVVTALVATAWHVSEGVVTYRLLDLGEISDDIAGALFRIFASRWKAAKAKIREERDPDAGGPTYYITRRARLGEGLLGLVRRALNGDMVTHTTAARILGVSPASVDPLLKRAGRAV